MSGICGWFDGAHGGSGDPQAIAAMAAQLNRFDGSAVHTASAAFGAVAAAGADADVFQDGERLVAVWGKARFADPELTALAGGHGVARAFAEGYARKGSSVMAAVSGACAVAVLNG